MLSKNQLKTIRALGQKKHRKNSGQFLVQGEKNVVELLQSDLTTTDIFATERFIGQYQKQFVARADTIKWSETDIATLSKVSTLSANDSVIAIANMPEQPAFIDNGLTVALDGVSDPGNLGTIIRVADWYGIKQVVVGHHCADPYNPKTISATMGSFTRVELVFADLTELLANSTRAIYGAFLEGENIHRFSPNKDAIIVMGSESHGISEEVAKFVTSPITIPRFGHAESLNVAMATGIILDNFLR